MTQGLRTAGLTALLLLVAAVLVLGAAPAWADGEEEQPAAEKTPEAGSATLTSDRLEERLMDNEGARWALIVGRILPILVGIILLVLWFIRWDKIKGGALPRPPRVVTTQALPLGPALWWAICGLALGPFLTLALLVEPGPDAQPEMWHTVVAMGVAPISVAVFLLILRRRMHRTPPAEFPVRYGPGVPAPTQPPSLLRAFGLGLWGVCIAGVVVIPAMLAWALLLTSMGAEAVTQGPVQQVVDPRSSDTGAILMVVFGIFIAPFTEECIFRGMLYPGLKNAVGGGRRGVWIGALVVSALFAAVHTNLFAFVPLFVLALVLNWVFETTNSLAAVIFIHALHNGITMVPLLILRYSS